MTSNSEVVLASLNSHGGRGADGIPFDLTAACRLLGADVITMQECWLGNGEPDPLAVFAAGAGARVLRADLMTEVDLRTLSISGETGLGWWGLAMVTTLPVIASEAVALGRAPGDVTPRAAQLVTLRVPGGGALRVVNTHLTYRLTSPAQLMRLVRHLLASDVPTVIAGDLNMPWPVTGLAVGYRPAVKGGTFPAGRPLLQLDHVLAGAGVAFHGGEVLPPSGSDHRAIRVRLRLAPAKRR
jgi:endonuclease/exonuclease/phosphatase family metal-dependent hydrolase